MKQLILNWNYKEGELSLLAFLRQMTEDKSYYIHSVTPITYTVSQGGVWGPQHYANVREAVIILNSNITP